MTELSLCTLHVRSVFAYAMGYAVTELSLPAPEPESGELPSEIELLVRIMQAVPRDTPAASLEVASTICFCDMDRQFTFGLDLMLKGLASHERARGGEVKNNA